MRPQVTVKWWVLAPAIGLAVWNLVARTSAVWPFDIHLRDDAYYYYVWARNLADGAGPCVTDGVWTSGVHLLWGLLLAGAALLTDQLPGVSVALGLGLHLASGWVIHRATPDRRLGVLAAAVYLGSPFLAVEAINGQETGLACCALALFCVGYRRSGWTFFGLGLLAVAARSDLWLFVGAVALTEPGQRRRRLGAAAAILLCYAAWNLLLGGAVLQHSAAPMPWLMAETLRHDVALGESHRAALLTSIARAIPFRNSSTPMALAWLLAAVLGLRRGAPEFAWLLLGGLGLVGLHHLWRLYPRDYYFAPLGVVGVLAVLRLRAWYPRLGLLLLALGLLWNGRHLFDPAPARNWQREMTMAGRFLSLLVPPTEAVGCFNSGIVTWQRRAVLASRGSGEAAAGGPVVNLDGVVNPAAFAALRRHALLGYLREQGVRYLVDNPVQFATTGLHANGRFFGAGFAADADLREVARFVWPADPQRGSRREGTGWFGLYRLVDGRPGSPVGSPVGSPTVAPAVAPAGSPTASPTASPTVVAGVTDLGAAPGGRYVSWAARAGQRLRRGATRDASATLFDSAEDLVYVFYLEWDRRRPLRLWLGDQATPILAIAPR